MDNQELLKVIVKAKSAIAKVKSLPEHRKEKCIKLSNAVGRLLPFVEDDPAPACLPALKAELLNILDEFCEYILKRNTAVQNNMWERTLQMIYKLRPLEGAYCNSTYLSHKLQDLSIGIGMFGQPGHLGIIQAQEAQPDLLESFYVILDDGNPNPIGAGSFAQTYRVSNNGIKNHPYAMKRFTVNTETNRAMLEKEGKILKKLTHPYIARYVTSFYSGGEQYYNIVMELGDGGTLAEVIASQAPGEAQILGWARQMASALTYMHWVGVVHRDLKPENVVLTLELSKIQIIDMGLARLAELNDSEFLTAGVGTKEYSSPEKKDGHAYDARDDVWAMGCILLELVIRRRFAVDGQGAIRPRPNPRCEEFITEAEGICAPIGVGILPRIFVAQSDRFTSAMLLDHIRSLYTPQSPSGEAEVQQAVADLAANSSAAGGDNRAELLDVPLQAEWQARRKERFFCICGAVGIASLLALLMAHAYGLTDTWSGTLLQWLQQVISLAKVEFALALLRDKNLSVAEVGAESLGSLMAGESSRNLLIASQVVPLCLAFLDTGRGRTAARMGCLTAFQNLPPHFINAELIAANGAVPVFAKMLGGIDFPEQEVAVLVIERMIQDPLGIQALVAAAPWEELTHVVLYSSDAAASHTASILMRVSANATLVPDFVKAGLPVPLVQLLGSDRADTRTAAVTAVVNVAASADGSIALAAANVIPALLRILRDGSADAKSNVTRTLCRILPVWEGRLAGTAEDVALLAACLSANEQVSAHLRRLQDALKDGSRTWDLIAAGGPEILTKLLSNADAHVSERASDLVLTLVLHPDGVAAAIDAAPARALLSVLFSVTVSDVARSNAAVILGVLSSDAEVQSRIEEKNATAKVLEALKMGGRLSREQTDRAMLNILPYSVSSGYIPIYVHLLSSAVLAGRERAVTALYVCSATTASREFIVPAGALPQLVQMLKNDSSSSVLEQALGVMVNLAEVPRYRDQMVNLSALEHLPALLDRGTDGAKEHTVRLLRKLAEDPKLLSAVAASGVVEPLAGLLMHPVASVQEGAALVIELLVQDPLGVQALVAAAPWEKLTHVVLYGSDVAASHTASILLRVSANATLVPDLVKAGLSVPLVQLLSSDRVGTRAAAVTAAVNFAASADGSIALAAANVIPALLRILRDGSAYANPDVTGALCRILPVWDGRLAGAAEDVALLATCLHDDQANEQGSAHLRRLQDALEDASRTADLIAAGGPEILTKLLSSADADVSERASDLMLTLVLHSGGVAAALTGAEPASALLRLLHSGTGTITDTARSNAAAVLGVLASDQSVREYIEEAGATAEVLVALEKGSRLSREQTDRAMLNILPDAARGEFIPCYVRLLGTEVRGGRDQAVAELYAFSANTALRESIVKAGALPQLVQMLKNGSSSGAIEQALGVMVNLVDVPEYRMQMVNLSALDPLQALLESGTDGAKEQAVRLLRKLAEDPKLLSAVAASGVVAPLTGLLMHPAASVQEGAALVIDLLVQDPLGALALVAAEPWAALAHAALNGSEALASRAVSVLLHVSANATLVPVLVKAGLPVPVVQLLRSDRVETRAAAVTAVVNFAASADGSIALAAANVIPALLRILRDGSAYANPDVTGALCRILPVWDGRLAGTAEDVALLAACLHDNQAYEQVSAYLRMLQEALEDASWTGDLIAAGGPEILTKLLDTADADVSERASDVMLTLALHADGLLALSGAKPASALLRLLRSGTATITARCNAAAVLGVLASDPAVWEYIENAEATAEVLDALKKGGRLSREQADRAMLNILPDMARAEIIPANVHLLSSDVGDGGERGVATTGHRVSIVKAGAVPQLVQMLNNDSSSGGAIESALGVMVNLAEGPRYREQIVNLSALGPLPAERGTDDAKAYAVPLPLKHAPDPTLLLAVATSGVAAPLVGLLAEHAADASLPVRDSGLSHDTNIWLLDWLFWIAVILVIGGRLALPAYRREEVSLARDIIHGILAVLAVGRCFLLREVAGLEGATSVWDNPFYVMYLVLSLGLPLEVALPVMHSQWKNRREYVDAAAWIRATRSMLRTELEDAMHFPARLDDCRVVEVCFWATAPPLVFTMVVLCSWQVIDGVYNVLNW